MSKAYQVEEASSTFAGEYRSYGVYATRAEAEAVAKPMTFARGYNAVRIVAVDVPEGYYVSNGYLCRIADNT